MIEEFVPLCEPCTWRDECVRIDDGESFLVCLCAKRARLAQSKTRALRSVQCDHKRARARLKVRGDVKEIRALDATKRKRATLRISSCLTARVRVGRSN